MVSGLGDWWLLNGAMPRGCFPSAGGEGEVGTAHPTALPQTTTKTLDRAFGCLPRMVVGQMILVL